MRITKRAFNSPDLIGKKFGRLLVIEDLGSRLDEPQKKDGGYVSVIVVIK